MTTALGYLAGLLTTIAFLPQLLRIWRTKSAHDLSLPTFSIFCGGVACWLAYGVLIGDPAIIAANVVTLAIASTVLVLAVRYR